MEQCGIPDFEFSLLGPPALRLKDRILSLTAPDKPFFLLLLLATTRDALSREEVCDILWTGVEKGRARASLSTALYNLSARIGLPDFPGKTRTTLFWNAPDASADIRRILFSLPPKGCDRLHPPYFCPSCREELLTRLTLLSRPFLEAVSLPSASPLERWAERVRESLSKVRKLIERDLSLDSSPLSPSASVVERSVEVRPLVTLVLNLSLSEALPDDELIDRLEPVRTAAEERIFSRGGFLLSTPPTEIVAYFGYPRCREEEARVAALCAREILETPFSDPALRLSIGLHGGSVPCDYRRGIPDPTGRLSLVARKAAERAPKLSVVATEEVALQLRRHHVLSPFSSAGSSPDLPLFLVRGELLAPARENFVRSEVFGREEEFALLRGAWEETRQGARRTIWIEGEAGIGKSALAGSFIREVESSLQPSLVREYFCLPEHQGTPWYPIVRFLRRHIGLDDPSLSPLDRTYHLECYLLDKGRPPERDLPLLRHLLGEPGELSEIFRILSPDRLRETIEAFLLDVISHLARTAPFLLVMEDLHWADQATLALLEKSLARLRPIPMMMILTCRNRRSLEALSLPPPDVLISLTRIDRQSGRRLVAREAGRTLSPSDLRRVLDLGGGIPLYLRELALLARNESLPVPPTLEALFASRTDALPERMRGLLHSAAALGIVFREETLRSLASEPDSLRRDLDVLCQSGLFDPETSDPPTYAFHHALLRESVLATLSAPARRLLHGRIAELFTDSSSGTAPEERAYHLAQAGRLEEAVTAYRLTAVKAAKSGATADAALHIEEALSLVRENPDHFSREIELALLLEAGPLAVSLKGHGSDSVAKIYDRASELARNSVELALPFPVRFGLWTSTFTRIGPAAARPLGEELVHAAREAGDPELSLRASYALGGTLCWTGELALSTQSLLEALSCAQKSKQSRKASELESFAEDPEMGARAYLCWTRGISGDPEGGQEDARKAIRRAEEIDHPNSLGYALAFDCYLKMLLGDTRGAGAVARRTREMAERYGFLQWEVVGQVAASYADGKKGSLPASRASVLSIEEVLPGLSSLFILIQAMTAMRAGEPEEAGEVARRGLQSSKKTGAVVFDPELLRLAGESLLLMGGAPGEAAELFRQGIARARESGAALFGARCAHSLLRIHPGEEPFLEEFLTLTKGAGENLRKKGRST